MAGWRFRSCVLFKNKEAVTIILWYATCVSVNALVFKFINGWIQNGTVILIATSASIIVPYLVLGLFADVFIGRYGVIQFSLWVKLLTVIVCTLIIALVTDLKYLIPSHTWLQVLLYSFICFINMLGESSFHVVAVQFGTDQLQGASSEVLSAFIFWYFMAEIITKVFLRWIFYFSSLINPDSAQDLYVSLIISVFVSAVLAIKNCFMSEWFVKETVRSKLQCNGTSRCHGSGHSNAYLLIFEVLKFAKNHKCPIQRSALTYWEDEVPSRIDLGKRKYGGPFTTEQVEDVKTFFQLLKLMLSLSGVLITSYLIQIYSIEVLIPVALESYNKSRVDLICSTATIILLILHYVFPCCHKCHLSMLKRIGIGAALTIINALAILLTNSINCVTSIDKGHQILLHILYISSHILYMISNIVFIVPLFEFIIAQSPHTMKGILIGFYYIIRFGLAGVLALIERYTIEKLSYSGMILYIVIIVIALLSFTTFSIVSRKYKLRERDEVVNVHIFAEEYYGTQGDDSSSDYSDVD